MAKVIYDTYEYNFGTAFKGTQTYNHVQLAKHVKKGADKLLLVLDYMPTEDLKSSRVLSGVTGDLLKKLLAVTNKYYGYSRTLDDFDWLAVAFNGFKTAGETDIFKQSAKDAFKKRLESIITSYKPNTVLTFGPDGYRALNGARIEQYGGKMQHLYGVSTPIIVKRGDKSHKCNHVPTLSLNTLINDQGLGNEMALAGYVARNIGTALNGEMRYKIPKLEYTTVLVDSIKKFKKMIEAIIDEPRLSIDTETENLNRRVNRMLTVQFATTTKTAYVLPFLHKDSPFTSEELQYIKKVLRDYFERKNKNDVHIFANGTFDLTVLRNNLDIRFFKTDIWDIFAGEFALDENLKNLSGVTGAYYYSLLNLSMQYGCTAYYDAEFGKDKRKTIAQVDLDEALLEYCSLDVIIPLHIMRLQLQRAKDEGYKKYKDIVRKQISDMIHMFSTWEFNGCPTDIEYLFYLQTRDSPIRQEMDNIKKKFYETKGVQKANAKLLKKSGMPTIGLFGRSDVKVFDIAKQDHQQLLFFDVLKLKPTGKGKENSKGKAKFKVDKTFQKKYEDVEEVKLFQALGKAKKLYTSYVKAFIKQWGSDDDMRFDKRIRPHFGFLDVVTGRTSAQKPSLHQIPSRPELGKHIKRLFITEKGRILIKVDYSAHEVRCLSLDSYVSTEIGMVKLRDIIEMHDKPLVHSFNHETCEVELKEIGTQSVHPPEEDMYEIGYYGGTITVTGNHQIWSVTRNDYIRADEIVEGDALRVQYSAVKVTSIRKVPRPELVCDIGIADNHNLFVCDKPEDTPVLVHNCWSLFTGDKTVADLFANGRALREQYKLHPDPELLKRVKLEGDVHKINAAYFFGIPIEKVDKKIRDAVKAVIFGLIYQQGMNGLSKSTGQTVEAIEKLVAQFKKKHPVGVKWFDAIKQFARDNLYVESPIGRRRHTWGHLIPKNATKNADSVIARNERQSVNSPIQGIGSDFLINGARSVERLKFEHFEKTGHYPDFYQANSVHDSISFSCAYEDVWLALDMIERGLTDEVAKVSQERHGMDFIVPLEIDFEIGNNERDCEGWTFSIEQLGDILKSCLKEQQKLYPDMDAKAVYNNIMREQYEYMPSWAKTQAWNCKLKMSGMDKSVKKKAA